MSIIIQIPIALAVIIGLVCMAKFVVDESFGKGTFAKFAPSPSTASKIILAGATAITVGATSAITEFNTQIDQGGIGTPDQ